MGELSAMGRKQTLPLKRTCIGTHVEAARRAKLEMQPQRFVALVFFGLFVQILLRQMARDQLLCCELTHGIDIHARVLRDSEKTLHVA